MAFCLYKYILYLMQFFLFMKKVVYCEVKGPCIEMSAQSFGNWNGLFQA